MRPLPGLQALRGIAALLVVLTHAAQEVSGRGGGLDDLPFGNFGVDIFFVISGFIIVYSSVPAFTRPRASVGFLLRRVVRVVPLYWIVSSAYLLFVLASRTHRGLTFGYVASSYLFIPAPEPEDGAAFPFYFPGWTLEFEMFFYLCFSFVLPWRRPVAVAGIAAIMSAVLAIGHLMPAGPVLSFVATTQLFEFVAGCLLAEACLRGFTLPGPICLALAAIALTVVFVTSYRLGGWPELRGLIWGLPAASLVAAVVLSRAAWIVPRASASFPSEGEQDGVGEPTPSCSGPRPPNSAVMAALTRLGDASYSLYLVHYLVFVAVAHAVPGTFREGAVALPLAYMAFILILAIGTAILTFHAVERPLTRRLRRWIPDPRGAAEAP